MIPDFEARKETSLSENNKMNILLVDDETVLVDSVKICLENQGYRVITASNAQQALNQLYHQGHLIDLVITDYLMPGMNGIDLLKTIRKDSPTLPVIIMTAYATKNLALEAMKNHCTGFVEKPFKPNQLLDEIERIKTYHYQNEKSDDLDDHLPRIVHQINNPLAVINGTAELILKERPKSEELQNNARNILEAARQIGRINKIIMEADRLDRKKFKPVQIDKLLGNCLDMFTTLFHSKNISVKEKISDHMLCVRGSQFELEQVINNLILNGLEAMEDRPVKRLCITLLPSVDSATLDITIEDTGCGISEELLPNIFKPYVTQKSNGNGLGLNIIKEIIEKHEGEVFVESQVDQGSKFTVRLPAMELGKAMT